MIYAVIDTNVLVSALLTSNIDAATVKVVEALMKGQIIPLFDKDIIKEYAEVLKRPKFNFSETVVDYYIRAIMDKGLVSSRVMSKDKFPDPKDIVFYEVALSKDDAYLVTGNKKHFPISPIVVSPAEMIEILTNKMKSQK
jgi:putative PIN family toxin of toxin-antitoxin system